MLQIPKDDAISFFHQSCQALNQFKAIILLIYERDIMCLPHKVQSLLSRAYITQHFKILQSANCATLTQRSAWIDNEVFGTKKKCSSSLINLWETKTKSFTLFLYQNIQFGLLHRMVTKEHIFIHIVLGLPPPVHFTKSFYFRTIFSPQLNKGLLGLLHQGWDTLYIQVRKQKIHTKFLVGKNFM